jgi:hypothetical protein
MALTSAPMKPNRNYRIERVTAPKPTSKPGASEPELRFVNTPFHPPAPSQYPEVYASE